MLRRRSVALALTALLAAAPAFAQDAATPAPTPLTLDQAMADPDWIGPPVEQAWWSWDGRHVQYVLKRAGGSTRDTFEQALDGGAAQRVDDAGLARLDASGAVYDRARRQMLFVRNGDVFLRDLSSGVLRQITRTGEDEADPQFAADGRQVQYRVGTDWYRWSPEAGVAAVALPRAEKDPATPPASEPVRDQVLRLSKMLSGDEAQAEAARKVEEARRRADPTRAATPVYFGDTVQIDASSLSPDGRWLLVVTSAKGADTGRAGKMPKYLTASGYEEMEDVRTRVGHNAPVPQALHLVELASGRERTLAFATLPGADTDPLAAQRAAAKLAALKDGRAIRITDGDSTAATVHWTGDGSRVAVLMRAVDNKDRWIATAQLAGATLDGVRLSTANRLTDAAWINWNFNEFGWLPDDRTLWWLSEQSGYSHLYTLSAAGNVSALTDGRWETSTPIVSADGREFYFLCNREWPGDYEVCAVPAAGGAVREVTALDGVEDFALSPDGGKLLVRYSGSYLPAQLAVQPVAGGKAQVLTDTRTAGYKARGWIAPQFVQVPSTHGAGTVWGKLYRPAVLEPGRKYPLVLFVHGAGYTQNVHARFPYYFREQMFHNLLVQQGYVVLDLDYRASEGYGRDWRTAIYRRMGEPELQDVADGVAWMAAHQQADPARVGIYGGSYGGFLTLMALFRHPDEFVAGAALRPVTDWATYNHEYTSNILNTPDLDADAYRASSPIEYADGLRGHLLIAHGMIDDNVFFQDSVRLAQRLIELKKDHWELAPYPLERHSFVHAESWYDEYRRIDQLFERTLK
jgi:dipeptidyl aminopeptidase/acylaminoacyl peptidase